MEQLPESMDLELIYVIVNSGLGSKVLHIAKQNGISGGTIFLGQGTVKNRFLETLALQDVRKEIVLMVTHNARGSAFLKALNTSLKLCKPNHGIAYCVPVFGVCGSRSCLCNHHNVPEGGVETMYQSIITVVDKGLGETVAEVASHAGAKGATIINARGAGVHETSKLFAMEIEPEKEIVLMILKREQVDSIVASIREKLQIDKPGNGILFIQDVAQTYGLFESI